MKGLRKLLGPDSWRGHRRQSDRGKKRVPSDGRYGAASPARRTPRHTLTSIPAPAPKEILSPQVTRATVVACHPTTAATAPEDPAFRPIYRDSFTKRQNIIVMSSTWPHRCSFRASSKK